MMCSSLPLLLLAVTSALAAPAIYSYDDYSEVLPQKRAALVLDRLLMALQKTFREDPSQQGYERSDRDGPRASPLRVADDDVNDVSVLQRRGQGNTRGRVLRCYFNAVTCF